MKPEDRAYILKHAGRQSLTEMARHLGLKERSVRRFLETREETRASGGPRPRRPRKALWLSVALIAMLGAAVYANSIGGAFIWDDVHLVKNNAYIKNPANLAGLFTKKDNRKEYAFYRPLQETSYMLDYAFWRDNAKGYHATNIILHILTALAVFWLINLLFARMSLALITAGLFVVHPVHTEAVAYISGRADIMAALFILLAFILYIKQTGSPELAVPPVENAGAPATGQTRKNAILCARPDAQNPWLFTGMLISYAGALLSKESSLILPVLLGFYHAAFKKGRAGAPLLGVWVTTGLYLVMRLTVMRYFLTLSHADTTLWQRIPGAFVALAQYLRILGLPFGLHMEYGNGVFAWSDPWALAGAALFVFLIVYAFKKRRSASLVFFCVTWFFITLLPQANLYPINAYMSEHWLYLPSIGFFALLAGALDLLYRRRGTRLAVVAVGAMVLFYATLSVRQNGYWNDPFTFYKKTLVYAPESPRLLNNFGILTYEKGDAEEAVAIFKKTIAADPAYAEAYNNLGKIYKDARRMDEAMDLFKKAIEIDPAYAEAYNNLAIAYFLTGNQAQAIQFFKKAVALRPDFANAYFNLAVAYFNEKDFDLATQSYAKAEALGLSKPDFAKKLSGVRVR